MTGSNKNNEDLLQQLMDMIGADLESRDRQELEGLLSAVTGQSKAAAPKMLISSNHAVMVFLHPKAGSESAMQGLGELIDWLDENWSELERTDLSKTPARLLN